jgi:iron complex outermembrane recepter protein
MGTVDVSGNQQQFVSRFTGTLGVDYQWETGWRDLVGKVGANYQFRSAYYFDVQNTLRQPGYGLLNAYAGLENDRYAAFVYARNIGDKNYRTVASDLGNGTLVSRGDPLTVGASLKLKF